MRHGFIIAIDGPVASGKGTIAVALADRLSGFHIYTGGTYRALALYCIQNNIDPQDEKKVIEVLGKVDIDLRGDGAILLNGINVAQEITRRDVANVSSPVSAISKVREEMVEVQQRAAQREISEGRIVVAEGRDTATKVFPDAAVRIYLTAIPEVRAHRRLRQYNDEKLDLETMLSEVHTRDERDMSRTVDPLVRNPHEYGYIVIDNSEQTQEETLAAIIKEIEKKGLL